MTVFRGNVGIKRGETETRPGVFTPEIDEIDVIGELRSARVGWAEQKQGDRVSLRHTLSMITPEGSDIDINEVVYVIWRGRKHAVTAIEYKHPRIELSLGGLYNG